MSSVIADNSPCHALPQVRAAIPVKVGGIDITAMLDVDCALNALHRRLLKRIFEQGNDHRKSDDVENVELDLTIDGRLVALKFHVFSDLYTDMALGKEFFSSVQADIDVEHGLLKWSYQELVTTKLVKDDADFKASSAGSGNTMKETSAKELNVEAEASKPHKVENEATPLQNDHLDEQKKKKEKVAKSSSQASGSTSIDEDLQSLHLGNKSKKRNKNKEVVKIFIADVNLWDIFSGECLAYYGVYSSQKEIKVLKNELLQRKVKTPLGFYMQALSDAFDQARKHQVKHLHIVCQDQSAVQIMKAQLKLFKEDGVIDPDEIAFPSWYPDDRVSYFTACYDIPGYESLKFEYVSPDDTKYEEMKHLINLLEEYAEKNPM